MPHKEQPRYIRIEPREIYDQAIIKESPKGELTYSYWRLIECVMEEWEYKDIDEQSAVEWVDYNIVGLAGMGFKVSYNRKYAR